MTNDQMSLFDAIYNCRAMRKLDTRDVPEADLKQLIDAANQAPSGSNCRMVGGLLSGMLR